jgi:hypothetical protein
MDSLGERLGTADSMVDSIVDVFMKTETQHTHVRILTESSQPDRDAAFYGKMLSSSSCADCSCVSPIPFLKKIMSFVMRMLKLDNQTPDVDERIQCIRYWTEKYKDGKPLLERVCRLPSVKEANVFGLEDRDFDKEDCLSRLEITNCIPTEARDLEATCLLAGFRDASLLKILSARCEKRSLGENPSLVFLSALRSEIRLESVRFASFALEKSMGPVGYYKNFFSLSKRLTGREFPNSDFADLVKAFGSGTHGPKDAVILYLQKAGITDPSALDAVSEVILEKENEPDVVPLCSIVYSANVFFWKDIDASLTSFLEGTCDEILARSILRVVNGHTLAKCLSCLDVEWLAGFETEGLETTIKNETIDFYSDEFASTSFWRFVIRHILELRKR